MKLSSDISLWWLLPIAAIAVLVALWMYNKKTSSWVNELEKKWRIILISLRSLSIILLAILLLGIIFQSFNYKKEKPILLLGIDDSSSMLNYADSSKVSKQIEELLAFTEEELGDKFELITTSFASQPKLIDSKINFSADITDLNEAIEITRSEYYNRNLAGILLVSDGNYNRGTNPIYAAEKLSTTSIFTLGVGDTIVKKDQLIKHILHNDVAFLKNDFPVVVDIEGNKMGKSDTEVSIELNGRKVASHIIQFKDGVSDYEQVSFTLKAEQPGIQQYTVKLSPKDSEYNYQNNQRTFYVEVIDSRSKILLLSQAPHPDISALKSTWEKDQNLEVDFKLLSDWDRNLKNVDLIVWHEPGLNSNREIQDYLLNNPISKLMIIGSQSNASSIYQLNLGMEIPVTKNLDDIEASLNTGFTAFEVSDKLKNALNYFPPLKSRFGKMKTPKDATILLNQRVGPVVKSDPLIYFSNGRSSGGQSFKYGVIYGEGIWRWKLTEYARSQEVAAFDELIGKTGQYLMVKQNMEPFRITLPKKFTPTESISINATVLNASLEPITTTTVQFVLTNEHQEETKLQFGTIGTSYQLDLGKLDSGKYRWKAFTTINGKHHEKKGEFSVAPLYLEQLSSHANHGLLSQLSEKTNGTFHELKHFRSTLKELQKRDDFTTISYQDATFNELIEYFIVFILLVLTLCSEWFLRRYLGSY